MINKNAVIALITGVFVWYLVGCRKDPTDSVSYHTVHGQVYNLCTNKGLGNVTVFLNTTGSSSSALSVVSDINGNFSFNGVTIHSSSDYSYSLYIPSKSGIGVGSDPGFDGMSGELDKSGIDLPQRCNVAPHFRTWNLYFPNTLFSSNDTFVLTTQQKVFHDNSPSSNYKMVDSCPCAIPTPTHFAGGLNNYWMGWWQVTFKKTKNGIQTTKVDSFYVDWGATVTDTVPF